MLNTQLLNHGGGGGGGRGGGLQKEEAKDKSRSLTLPLMISSQVISRYSSSIPEQHFGRLVDEHSQASGGEQSGRCHSCTSLLASLLYITFSITLVHHF